MDIKHIRVGGEDLRVGIQRGAGVPLIICSELGANLELMQPFIDAMPEAEIVVFDSPGTGQSSQYRRLRRMAGYVRLLRGLIDSLAYTQPVDLLGMGWGGLLVQKFAYDHPERARRLVLVSTSPGQIMFPGRWKTMLRLSTPERIVSARLSSKIARNVYGGRVKYEPALICENARHAIVPSRLGYLSQLLAAAGFSSLPWLHRLRAPCLILAGDDDPIVPLVNARLLNLLISRSRLEVVQGAGHLLLITRADDAARHISNFLRRSDVRQELAAKDTL